MRFVAPVLLASVVLAAAADAAVLCAKVRRSGEVSGNVKVRPACRPGEIQLAPEDVGFCCTVSSTTTSTTTGSCPTFTMTTLGIPDCGGSGMSCFGLCANARACVPNAQATGCGCTGAVQPCGVVTYNGQCGGSCPAGEACTLYSPPLPNGCTDAPRCACVLQ